MFLNLWCKKCGASLILIKGKAGNQKYIELLHDQTLTFEKECKFANIKIGVDLKNGN